MAALANDLGIERVALVANKIRDERDLAAVKEFASQHGLEIAGVVPFDEQFSAAERARQAPLDFDDSSPAVEAIGKLARDFVGAR